MEKEESIFHRKYRLPPLLCEPCKQWMGSLRCRLFLSVYVSSLWTRADENESSNLQLAARLVICMMWFCILILKIISLSLFRALILKIVRRMCDVSVVQWYAVSRREAEFRFNFIFSNRLFLCTKHWRYAISFDIHFVVFLCGVLFLQSFWPFLCSCRRIVHSVPVLSPRCDACTREQCLPQLYHSVTSCDFLPEGGPSHHPFFAI